MNLYHLLRFHTALSSMAGQSPAFMQGEALRRHTVSPARRNTWRRGGGAASCGRRQFPDSFPLNTTLYHLMADQTLASLTAATPATGGLIYGTQGDEDRKLTLTAEGAAVMEAADTVSAVNALLPNKGGEANWLLGVSVTPGTVEGDGTDGAAIGTVSLSHMHVESASVYSGSGGAGGAGGNGDSITYNGADGGHGGSAGNGGLLLLTDCLVAGGPFLSAGGTGYDDGSFTGTAGNAGSGGNGGGGGAITLENCITESGSAPPPRWISAVAAPARPASPAQTAAFHCYGQTSAPSPITAAALRA